jgi:ATP-dependent Clp protease ATP-binding subunit ClpC
MESIVLLQLKEVQDRLNEFGVKLDISPAARTWLAKQGYDPAFGARPLRRAIQKFVESPLSVELLGGKYAGGAAVEIDVEDDKIIFK